MAKGDAIEIDGVRYVQGKIVDSNPEWFGAIALIKADLDFEFQSSYFGGSFIGGGVVVDYRVFTVPKAHLWFIDGEYWHGTASARDRDTFQRFRLKARTGLPIVATPAGEMQDLKSAEIVVQKLFLS